MANDYHQLLGIKRTATESEIKQAYRRQSGIWRNRLHASSLERRKEAEKMLLELAIARKVLLKSKKYNVDKPKIPKKKKYKNRNKFSPLKTIEVGVKIIANGLWSAARHIFGIVGATALKICKIILQILMITFLVCQVIIGFGGLAMFVAGVHDRLSNVAFMGMACNYFSMSIVTFVFYFWDKRKAQLNLWRIPEARLHYLELLGGWIGAFLAQLFLRHKSSKKSFQLVYWLIVVFHFSLFLFYIPASFAYAIPQKYILMLNAFLLIISLHAIKNKGYA